MNFNILNININISKFLNENEKEKNSFDNIVEGAHDTTLSRNIGKDYIETNSISACSLTNKMPLGQLNYGIIEKSKDYTFGKIFTGIFIRAVAMVIGSIILYFFRIK